MHGGSSGIGTMAVQLGKAIGAKVAVTAGSAQKLAACAELGADVLVNYREQDFVAELAALGGADVILDVMGAKPKAKSTSTASTKPAAATSHSVSGTVKAMDATMLTVTPSGKDKTDLMVMMNTSTTKEGSLAVGSKVSVHYKEENGQKIATSVKASAAKPASSGKKK